MDIEFLILCILVLILVIFFPQRRRWHRRRSRSRSRMKIKERFESSSLMLDETITSRTLYDDDPKTMCSKLRTMGAQLSDDSDILSLRSCVMIKDPNEDLYPNMGKMLKKSIQYYMESFEMVTQEFNDVRSKIKEVLHIFANQVGGKIHGPVFALIFQAPYYRDFHATNATIHIQPFNIHEYKYRSMLMVGDDKEKEKEKEYNGNLMVVYMFYPMYSSTRQRIGGNMTKEDQEKYVSGCLSWFMKQSSMTETVCKMRCPSDPSSFCGCLNTREGKGNAPYTSVCLGPKDKDDYQKTTFVNYGMLYRIQEKNATMAPLFAEPYVYDACDRPRTRPS